MTIFDRLTAEIVDATDPKVHVLWTVTLHRFNFGKSRADERTEIEARLYLTDSGVSSKHVFAETGDPATLAVAAIRAWKDRKAIKETPVACDLAAEAELAVSGGGA